MIGKNLGRLFILCGLAIFMTGLVSSVHAADSANLDPVEQLGKSIFNDQELSINQNESCASCHAPGAGWTGPLSDINAHGAVYEGSILGRFGNRKPPSAAYATLSPIFHYEKGLFVGGNFWDGRATGEVLGNPAADQALGPFLNPAEQALPDSACVVYQVCTNSYPTSFESVWGAGACDIAWPPDIDVLCATEGVPVPLSAEDRQQVNQNYGQIGLSIAAFEGSSEVNAFSSKFDAMRKGLAKFTKLEREGFTIFQGKGKCSKCHLSTGQNPLFTDFTYDNLGIPKNPENPVYVYDPGFVDLGLGGFLASRPDYAKYAAENYGKFKVPTLRNVDLRSSANFVKAFGHNGYFKSLEEIVHFYNTRDVFPHCEDRIDPDPGVNCWPMPEVMDNMNTAELGDLGLSPDQESALVAFLKTLSDGYLTIQVNK